MTTTENDIEYRPHPTYDKYLVGSDGSIQGPSGKILRPSTASTGGRMQINLRPAGSSRKENTLKLYVSIMVAETWHGPRPEGQYALHRDGDHRNCSKDNVYWGSLQEHYENARKRGDLHIAAGEANGNAKISADDVREIRRAHKEDGVTYAELAKRYGLTPRYVGRVVRGDYWKNVTAA